MTNYKLKAEKYKIKYLNLKKDLIGGLIDKKKEGELIKKGIDLDTIELLKNIESINGELSDEQIESMTGQKKQHGVFRLPRTGFNVRTIHNPGTNNTCMYLSLRDILMRVGIVKDISVEQLRSIGGLYPIPDGSMWDNSREDHREALQRISNFFNIRILLHVTSHGYNKEILGHIVDHNILPDADEYHPLVNHAQPPLDVHIASMGIHFEAIERIIHEGGDIYYDIGRERRPETENTSNLVQTQIMIDEIIARSFSHNRAEIPIKSVSVDKSASANKSVSVDKSASANKSASADKLASANKSASADKSSSHEESGGIVISDFTKAYYQALVEGSEFNERQLQYHNLIDLLTDTRNKLLLKQRKYHEKLRLENESLRYAIAFGIDDTIPSITSEYERLQRKLKTNEEEINKVIRLLLEQINSFN